MEHTPYANHTDKELVAVVCNKEDPTDLELELMQRLENALADAASWKEEYENNVCEPQKKVAA